MRRAIVKLKDNFALESVVYARFCRAYRTDFSSKLGTQDQNWLSRPDFSKSGLYTRFLYVNFASGAASSGRNVAHHIRAHAQRLPAHHPPGGGIRWHAPSHSGVFMKSVVCDRFQARSALYARRPVVHARPTPVGCPCSILNFQNRACKTDHRA